MIFSVHSLLSTTLVKLIYENIFLGIPCFVYCAKYVYEDNFLLSEAYFLSYGIEVLFQITFDDSSFFHRINLKNYKKVPLDNFFMKTPSFNHNNHLPTQDLGNDHDQKYRCE